MLLPLLPLPPLLPWLCSDAGAGTGASVGVGTDVAVDADVGAAVAGASIGVGKVKCHEIVEVGEGVDARRSARTAKIAADAAPRTVAVAGACLVVFWGL